MELWFSDESGIEGDPRPRRRWAQPGKPRTVPHLGDHIRQNVIGAVCPQDGTLFSLIVDGVDTDVFQFFLDQMAHSIPKKEDKRQLLIVDNASWHKAERLNWHHFEPVYLPAYSPDFNPIERLWLRLKADWFWDFMHALRKSSSTDFALHSKASSMIAQKPLPSALSGNVNWQSL